MWRALLLSAAAVCATAQNAPWTVEKIVGDLGYAGSVAWNRDHLLISDVPAGKITKVDSAGPSIWREGLHAAGMAVDGDGRLYVCDSHQHRLLRIDPSKKNKEEVLADKFEGKRLNGPTAVAVGKNNHVFFTDSAFASADRERELSHYGVYHLTPRGELSLVSKMTGRPNGIALAPDGKTLFVVDSDNRTVSAWDIDRSGAASNNRVLFRVKEGVPNGIAAGADGRLYVAGRFIEVYDRTGTFDHAIEISEKPSDLVFGDAENANLYVAARTSVFRVRFAAKGKDKGGKSN
jgi:gluconolactonase